MITKWYGSCTDIHDQKVAEEEKEKALKQLQISESYFRRLFQTNIIGKNNTSITVYIIHYYRNCIY